MQNHRLFIEARKTFPKLFTFCRTVALLKLLQHECEFCNLALGLRVCAQSVLRLKAPIYRAGGRHDNALWPNEELRLVVCRLLILSPIYNDAACRTTSWGSTDICKTKKLALSTSDTTASWIYPLAGRRLFSSSIKHIDVMSSASLSPVEHNRVFSRKTRLWVHLTCDGACKYHVPSGVSDALIGPCVSRRHTWKVRIIIPFLIWFIL